MKNLILFSLITAISLGISGQEDRKWSDDLYFGGNLGLNLGTITYIDISPLVGYRLSDVYSAGFTLTYQYYNDKRFDVSGNVLGGSIFNRFNITEEVFLIGEFQTLSYSNLFANGDMSMTPRTNIPYLWLGGGYSQRIGSGRSALFVSFLYDVIQNPNGLVRNPQIRGGLTFGI